MRCKSLIYPFNEYYLLWDSVSKKQYNRCYHESCRSLVNIGNQTNKSKIRNCIGVRKERPCCVSVYSTGTSPIFVVLELDPVYSDMKSIYSWHLNSCYIHKQHNLTKLLLLYSSLLTHFWYFEASWYIDTDFCCWETSFLELFRRCYLQYNFEALSL